MAKAGDSLKGKPFKTVAQFRKMVDEYFEKSVHPTRAGLILHLGFNSKSAFNDFPETVGGKKYAEEHERARLFLEAMWEARLHGTNPTGAIFALKNMGWTDRQVLDAELKIAKIVRKVVKPKS